MFRMVVNHSKYSLFSKNWMHLGFIASGETVQFVHNSVDF